MTQSRNAVPPQVPAMNIHEITELLPNFDRENAHNGDELAAAPSTRAEAERWDRIAQLRGAEIKTLIENARNVREDGELDSAMLRREIAYCHDLLIDRGGIDVEWADYVPLTDRS